MNEDLEVIVPLGVPLGNINMHTSFIPFAMRVPLYYLFI